jgi:acetyl/propionyl-CoA carboxylase alpha subunit
MRLEATVDGRTIQVEVRREDGRYALTLDGTPLTVDLAETGDHFLSLIVNGCSYDAVLEKRPDGYRVHLRDGEVTVALAEGTGDGARPARRARGPERLTAPMPGRVVRVLAEEGREVGRGEGLVVIEAMKMENELKAPREGRVREIAVREGQAVEAGALLVVVA